ncbi:SusC/RagA family TonB-linked outer membrane protein, partial [Chitinophaga sp.]|uniref:SusC/RagA family TonB-linked outer membrane protein n=1 Tax=Chitinophaga sp. TaxID=1869181 RepID=UPI002636B504
MWNNLISSKWIAVPVIMLLLVISAGAKGQTGFSRKITVNFKDTPLKEALKTITREAGTVFVYTSNDPAFQARVTYSASAENAETVIKKILAQQQLAYKVMEGKVLIEKVQPPAPQEKPLNLTGKVVDESNGEPMPGVSVRLKGGSLGATTDAEGLYHLKGVPPNATLIFSLLGYGRQEIALAGRGILNVNMKVSASELSETVVIGYGTQKRSDLTGSVGSVNVNDMNKAPISSFDEALAGRVAGVQVSSSEGQPGAGVIISIRGNNSLTQDNSPLYVIDGFPIETSNNNLINPDDIESIDILKDASATAIYGARGANGVIIITTKRGKTGAPSISYNGRYGWMENIQRIPVMSAYEFVKLQQEINVGDLGETYLANGTTLEDYRNVQGIDWQGKLYRIAPQQNHSISMRGGSDKTRYSVSGQALDQQGTIINSAFKRLQAKVSLDQQINDQLKVGGNITYTNNKTTGTTPSAPSLSSMNNLLYSAWGYRPTGPLNSSKPINENFEDELIDDMVNSGTDYRINPFL